MVAISPSILSCDFSRLGEQIQETEKSKATYLHIDVMDGMFVPNITLGPMIISSIRPLSSLIFDVHLMIEEPIRYIDDFRKAGADCITVHLEACSDVEKTLLKIKESGAKVGISIRPSTNPKELLPYLSLCDMILVMTVEPGFAGQSFIYSAVENIKSVKRMIDELQLEIKIEVDGGITVDTIKIAADAGAEIFVAGSAIYSKSSISTAVENLIAAANQS